jgi:kynurenine formamidase
MKIYDLSQPLNEQFPFWPFYPPFGECIKRKAEHGVNAQYRDVEPWAPTWMRRATSSPTAGRSTKSPVEWLCGPAPVDLSDVMDELELCTPRMIEDRVEVRKGDLLYLHGLP